MRRLAGEDGVVTAMVAVVAIALIVVAGLAYDGGALITATAHAHDIARAAARAGAQAVSPAAVHAGHTGLDPVAAHDAAVAFLATAGVDGTVTVDGATVTVTTTVVHQMRLLPLPDRTIQATGAATAVSDVLTGGP